MSGGGTPTERTRTLEPKTLLHVFPSFAIGGQQTRFATIAARLDQAYRHVIVSLDGRDMARSLLPDRLDARMLGVRRVSGPRVLIGYARAIRTVRPDALVTYNWGSVEWAILNRLYFGLPHVHFEDGFGRDEADRQLRRRVLTRRLVLRRSAVVVPSQTLATLATREWRLPPSRVTYIPNGIDAHRFDTAPDARGFFDRGDASCVIGAFAPLRAEKNLGRLLRAFARLDGTARLVICGDGPEAAPLRALAGGLGLGDRVTFTGHVRAPELIMGAFDVFAITSDTEQMPYAVLEAMCARLPVVGTDVGDIATMVHPDNRRFVVPRDEPESLVAALRDLQSDAGLRRHLGACNRADVESRFTIERMTSEFARVLGGAVSAA
jgi:glycosyltransferase involved in cell wall biosynthesis